MNLSLTLLIKLADAKCSVGEPNERTSSTHYGAHGSVYLNERSLRSLMLLVGHGGEIFATRFDSTGQLIASGSMDRSISQSDRIPLIMSLILRSAVANVRKM